MADGVYGMGEVGYTTTWDFDGVCTACHKPATHMILTRPEGLGLMWTRVCAACAPTVSLMVCMDRAVHGD